MADTAPPYTQDDRPQPQPQPWPRLRETLVESGWEVASRVMRCRDCGELIRWWKTPKGGQMRMRIIWRQHVEKPHKRQRNYQPHEDCPTWRPKPQPEPQAAEQPQEVCGGAS